MFGNQLYLDRVLSHYDQFPPLHTAAAEPVFQILAIPGHEHDSVFGELGHSSSGCSSYVNSPSSNCTTCGAQSPTLMQRSISCHSLITGNSDAYSSPPAYNIEPEKSHDSHQEGQVQRYNKWSNGQLASESIFESMNRATPYNAEEKKERIERYRSKRNLRNFNKKIKYECRKTLADSRPRVRGRFARNDDEIQKVSQPQWDCPFVDEDEGDDYSWIKILDALNKSDALISSF